MTTTPLLTIITDSHCFDHDTGGMDHPESPVRLEMIIDAIHSSKSLPFLDFVSSEPASREQLLKAHAEAWLFRFEESVLSGRTHIDHFDNQICYETFSVASLAAGAGIKAIDLMEKGEAQHCFCVVRPPGHHAEDGRPFGFCFFNNVLVATRHWQSYGRKRVAVVDFDAHHGNGIQSGLEREKDTFYISIHEHPSFSYPGTGYKDENGLGDGKGSILNIPLSPGSSDKQLLAALHDKVGPALESWKPDALIIAAGFDGHLKDDMSGLAYSSDVFRSVGEILQKFGNKYAGGRVLSILEGGYELSVLGESVEQYLSGLIEGTLR
ncbi:MAG: histone deacetylase [Desulfotalea sp.]